MVDGSRGAGVVDGVRVTVTVKNKNDPPGELLRARARSFRHLYGYCSLSWWSPGASRLLRLCHLLNLVQVLGCPVIIVVKYHRVLVLVLIVVAYFVGGLNELVTLNVYRDSKVRSCPHQVFRRPSSTLKPP